MAVCAAMRPKSSAAARDVARLDLVLVRRDDGRIELGLLGLAHLSRLGVDRRLLLLGGLGQKLFLELWRKDELEDAEVRGIAVEVDTRIARGAGLFR